MKPLITLILVFSTVALWSGSSAAETNTRLTLEQFLTLVQSQNLELQLSARSTEGSDANSTGYALPPPMVGVSQFKDMSGNAAGFEISQTIPFPSQLAHDHSARAAEAAGSKSLNKLTQKQTLLEARFNFFSLWLAQEKRAVLIEKKNALQEHLKLATAGARSDSFLKVHLLKTETDIDLLENEITATDQELRDRQIALAQMTQNSPEDFKPSAAEPPLTPVPNKEQFSSPPLQLEINALRLEGLQAREREAKASWLPEFNLKYREMSGTTMNPKYNELMLGMSLPFLYSWEPNRNVGKAKAERLQAELQLTQERLKIESRKTSLLAKVQGLKKQWLQLNEKIIPRAEKRMHLVHHIAPRDMETLVDHREALESFPDLKLKSLEIRNQYEESMLELLRYTSEAQP